MNLRTMQLWKTGVLALLIGTFGQGGMAQSAHADSGLTVHEWGTFTSIAGNDGQAREWLPLTGSTDLPGFVEHFRSVGFKFGLRGTVRMETPVLYFHAAHDMTVSVRVAFSKGLITEWYPPASLVSPSGDAYDASLYQQRADGAISWDSVVLEPGLAATFPRDVPDIDNSYYSARETSASPLCIHTPRGDQHEKFLFYRGVSVFPVPISAKTMPDSSVVVNNLGKDEIPNLILFERRGERVGYRISSGLPDAAVLGPLALTSTIDSLARDLEEILVARGLYRDEAHAMLKTWRNSWFEEGSRLFYILPASFIDTILPLTINPMPAEIVRVFVGRLELITPATEKAITAALATHDTATLRKYSRFLEPILSTMKEEHPAQARELGEALDALYTLIFTTARQKPAAAPSSPPAEPVRPQPCPVVDKARGSGPTATSTRSSSGSAENHRLQ